MKKFFTSKIFLSALAVLGLTSVSMMAEGEDPVVQEPAASETTAPSIDAVVKMTYVNGSDGETDKSYGEVAEALTGYNKIADNTVDLMNKGWGVNNITYIQVDASAAKGDITKATLTLEGSGSRDNKRLQYIGVGYNDSKWSENLTWDTADRSITLLGDPQLGTSRSATVFDTFEYDITDALKNSENNIVTILVYAAKLNNDDNGAGGAVIKNPSVKVEYEAAEEAGDVTVTYALKKDEKHAAGSSVDVKYEGQTVATLTFGFEGGAEFGAAAASPNDVVVDGFDYYTPGNGENGKENSGTCYIIAPKYDGVVEAAVVLNAGKAFFVTEDGTALADYNGIKEDAKVYKTYKFDVTGGKTYKVYCTGSKLGFYGFNYTFAAPAAPEYGTFDATVKTTYVSGTEADVDKAYGLIPEGSIAKCGYNKIVTNEETGVSTVELVNIGWGANWIVYLQVDASAAKEKVAQAILTFEGSGEQEGKNKRVTEWGVGYNNSKWSDELTWNTADRNITLMGETKKGTTKAADVFEEYEFDITEAFQNSEDNVATILVYELAAAGGNFKNPKVKIAWGDCNTTFNVVDEEAAPVADAMVTFGEKEGTTDENGNVTFQTGFIVGDEVAYSVYKDGYEFVEGTTTVEGGVTNLDVTLEASVCTANFKFMDEEGEPVAGAFLYFNDQEYEADENGSVVVSGKGWFGKTFQYTAMKDYLFAEGEVTFDEGLDIYPIVVLETPVCEATVKVMDAEGEPLAGAVVTVEGEEQTTNENGTASFSGKWIGTEVEYTVSAEGYDLYEGVLDFSESIEAYGIAMLSTTECEIAFLVRGTIVEGEVADEYRAIRGATITVDGQNYVTDSFGYAYVQGKGWVGKSIAYEVHTAGYAAVVGSVKVTGKNTLEVVDLEKTESVLMMIENGKAEVYDLNGLRVKNPGTGIYIVNGKKMQIIKK